MACRGSAVRIRYAPPFFLVVVKDRLKNRDSFDLMELKGQQLALACARAAEEMKAENIRLFDLRGLSSITDFMIVCSGNSMPHLKAILRDIDDKVQDETEATPHMTEGRSSSRWVVLDYIDVMVHVMHEEMRDIYELEELWGDGKEIVWAKEGEKSVADSE